MNRTTSKFLSLPPCLPWLYNNQLDTFTAGDVDGDGRQEIVVSNCPGTLNYTPETLGTAPALGLLSYFNYGDLEPSWVSEDWGKMLTMWTAQGIVPGAQREANWLLDFSSRFYTADVDGDGVDEVIAFSAENCSLGLFKWDGAGLRSLFAPLAIANDGSAYGYQVCGADIDGDGADEIIVFMPNSATFNVYQWNGAVLDSIFSAPALGNIPLLGSDQFFFPSLKRSSGDQKQQVFIYRDANPSCNVFEWNGSDFPSIFNQASINGFSFAADDQFFVGKIDGDDNDELLVYSPSIQNQTLSLLGWNGSAGFDLLWSAQGSVNDGNSQFSLIGMTKIFLAGIDGAGSNRLLLFNPYLGSPTPNGDQLCSLRWNSIENRFSLSGFDGSVLDARGTSPNNHFLCADVDGDGEQEFIVYYADDSATPITPSLTILKQFFQQFITQWSSWNCTPGWNLSVIVEAPQKTHFTPFEGAQLTIYQYVSEQVDSGGDNLRSTFTNRNDKYRFGGWAAIVEGNLLMTTPPNNFDLEDWRTVNRQLYIELNAVAEVYGLTSSREAIASAVRTRQLEELEIVKHNVQPAPAKDSDIDYWPEQVAVAAIWGMAAFPFADEEGESIFVINMAMSVVASLLGSYFSRPQSTPSVSSYYHLALDIHRLYDKAIDAGVTDEVRILTDAVMLPLVARLAERAWKIEPTDPMKIARHASKANRLYFYENLIPLTFNLMVWTVVDTPVPAAWTNSKTGGFWQDIGAQPYTFLSEPQGDGNYNIYLLYNGGGLSDWQDFKYPKKQLMDDLFSTEELNVPQNLFFQGGGVWSAIPCYSWAGGNCPGAAAEISAKSSQHLDSSTRSVAADEKPLTANHSAM
ncbi:MAG TPA: VCBS repeat-containing protein [Pyrinomonadaceae bacterium]|nr:VCBS repeat-containing protein [Pyrinomonadaceae bacterium]